MVEKIGNHVQRWVSAKPSLALDVFLVLNPKPGLTPFSGFV